MYLSANKLHYLCFLFQLAVLTSGNKPLIVPNADVFHWKEGSTLELECRGLTPVYFIYPDKRGTSSVNLTIDKTNMTLLLRRNNITLKDSGWYGCAEMKTVNFTLIKNPQDDQSLINIKWVYVQVSPKDPNRSTSDVAFHPDGNKILIREGKALEILCNATHQFQFVYPHEADTTSLELDSMKDEEKLMPQQRNVTLKDFGWYGCRELKRNNHSIIIDSKSYSEINISSKFVHVQVIPSNISDVKSTLEPTHLIKMKPNQTKIRIRPGCSMEIICESESPVQVIHPNATRPLLKTSPSLESGKWITVMRMNNMAKTDSGWYGCASLEGNPDEYAARSPNFEPNVKWIYLLVSPIPPKKSKQPKQPKMKPDVPKIVKNEDDVLELECTGTSPIHFIYPNEFGASYIDLKSKDNNKVIVLRRRRLLPRDAGWYGCAEMKDVNLITMITSQTHNEPSIKWIYVHIVSNKRPDIEPNVNEIYVNAGQRLEFKCKGNRPIQVTYPFHKLTNSLVREIQEWNGIRVVREFTKPGDSGWYGCYYLPANTSSKTIYKNRFEPEYEYDTEDHISWLYVHIRYNLSVSMINLSSFEHKSSPYEGDIVKLTPHKKSDYLYDLVLYRSTNNEAEIILTNSIGIGFNAVMGFLLNFNLEVENYMRPYSLHSKFSRCDEQSFALFIQTLRKPRKILDGGVENYLATNVNGKCRLDIEMNNKFIYSWIHNDQILNYNIRKLVITNIKYETRNFTLDNCAAVFTFNQIFIKETLTTLSLGDSKNVVYRDGIE